MTRRGFAVIGVLSVWSLGLAAGPAAAQPAVSPDAADARWTPWLGCWSLWQEQFESLDQLRDAERRDGVIDRTSVCVTPSGRGVSLRAETGDRVLVERQLVADGVRRDVETDGCRGWERSEWSADGQRLFTQGEIECDDASTRTVTGVSLLTSASSWVDIQLVRFDDREQLEVRRYSPMPTTGDAAVDVDAGPLPDDTTIRQARREAAASLAMTDVVEAAATSTPRVVEALLVETEPDLDVDAAALVALDDAGIDHGVIDLVVALSYPERFVVERRSSGGSWSSGPWSSMGGGAFYDPLWYTDPYYVTPLGYGAWGRGYNPYLYGATGSPFILLPVTGDQPVASGRAYRGRGYTRVRPRDTSVPDQVRTRGVPTTGGRSGGTRTGASSGGGASTGGYTRGGSSDGGGGSTGSGRRAVPRSR